MCRLWRRTPINSPHRRRVEPKWEIPQLPRLEAWTAESSLEELD